MSTPGKPRPSGIPGPGRTSSIPTPGRSRSTSNVYQQQHATALDVDFMSRAFEDAIKANDPAQHRASRANHISAMSNDPTPTIPQSGRRSVAGRPSSVASTSSLTSSTSVRERARTPTVARAPSRPPSRHSEALGKSPNRAFEIGDSVRIESLGYEGMLRYVGEIEGKVGLWAGVELSGGFSGKGKNNGTVNGKQYFVCPENCGVFVAIVKLSSPTAGPGIPHRPASVASVRGGRTTPAISGRVTPSASYGNTHSSISNGRKTPSSSGRSTPSLTGRATPGMANTVRNRRPANSIITTHSSSTLSNKITAGSRASKYISMTAKELSSRENKTGSPSRLPLEPDSPLRSPSHNPRIIPSPIRPTSSPFSTPKPSRISGIGVGVPSLTPSKGRLATPRGRIPSAIAMPPPASPISARSISMSEYSSRERTETVHITSDHDPPSGSGKVAPLVYPPRPTSAASSGSVTDESIQLDQLQARIHALEYDNERLRSSNLTSPPTDNEETRIQALEQERDDAMRRILSMETDLATHKYHMEEQKKGTASFEAKFQEALEQLEKERHSLQSSQRQLEEESALVSTLKDTIKEQEAVIQKADTMLKAKEADINNLELEFQSSSHEVQVEKNELYAQIDELRAAGQETIALYEERLSAADSQRYEMECRIASLEADVYTKRDPSIPPPIHNDASPATQIDNESLKDQVLHLQRKIALMEDLIEDTRAASEKEEAVLQERMKRVKEKEEGMKKELNEGRKEVERMLKSELAARGRVEEIEEALRESTVALENARAEVEVQRAELTNLDSLVTSNLGGDLSSRVADITQRASADRARYEKEINKLREQLEESRNLHEQSKTTIEIHGSEAANVRALESTNIALQSLNDDLKFKLKQLTQSLEERSNELDTMKKRHNRDVAINNGIQESVRPFPPSPSSKHDISAAREEITGLKHIVQELQKENLQVTQRMKMMESEKELLATEIDQLRQEVQILEGDLDKSVVHEEHNNIERPLPSDIQDLRLLITEQQSRFEIEQEQLRKRLAEAEMKSIRVTHDLNKEIAELEALVESKIYREDELEQELERLKDKLQRHKKPSKNSSDPAEAHLRSKTSTKSQEDVCEICERPGHDIFNCDLLREEVPTDNQRLVADVFCDDCESHGHVAADCPHSLDVF